MGHFEQGKWVGDEPRLKFDHLPGIERMEMHATVTVHVDDSELQELKHTLEQVQDLITPPVTFWGRLRWLLFGTVE